MGCGISKNNPTVKSHSRHNSKIKSTADDFIIKNQKKFTDVYQIGKNLGSGSYGEVKVVYHKITGQERAVKIYRKCTEQQDVYQKTKNEIEVLRKLSHPTIIKVFEYFEDEHRLYIVLEKCDGGELFYEISNKGSLSEQVSAVICKQLFSCIMYLHDNNIVHRDLKPENILLEDKGDLVNIKLIDFGTAVKLNPREKLSEMIGSSYYISPEIIAGSYDEKCDMWSLGVILYILLCGMPPFTGNSTKQILQKIGLGKYSMEGNIWNTVSKEAKDLVRKLICPAVTRITAKEALMHPWIKHKGVYPTPDASVLALAIENLKNFNSLNKFRDAISTFITSQIISIHETKDLRNIFKSIDINGDGQLSKEELIKGFNVYQQFVDGDEYIERIIDQVDTDGNGYIDYNEFIKATISQKKIYSKENMRKAFDMFDLDGNGTISSNELSKIFSLGDINDNLWNELVSKADKNFDGEIDFEEFTQFITAMSETQNLNDD